MATHDTSRKGAGGRLPARIAGAPDPGVATWRRRAHEVIFEADTAAGRFFDLALIATILLSVLLVMLESVPELRAAYAPFFRLAEWVVTLLFTVEYALRLLSVRRPRAYATSLYGVVDLLAILPTYLGLLVPGSEVLRVVRILRVLRIFRVLKLAPYLAEGERLARALHASRRKIFVFLCAVLAMTVILGSLMYAVEGEANGFRDIPTSVYWAIVTLTTVGYGDISPQTPAGQALAALIMLIGYGIIAVPTGIVTVEMARGETREVSTQACPACGAEGHDGDARHCKYCGARL